MVLFSPKIASIYPASACSYAYEFTYSGCYILPTLLMSLPIRFILHWHNFSEVLLLPELALEKWLSKVLEVVKTNQCLAIIS